MTKKSSIKVHKPKDKESFIQINRDLNSRHFVALDLLRLQRDGVKSVTLGDRDPASAQVEDMACGMGGGLVSNGPLAKVAWGFDSFDTLPIPVTDKDGNSLGRGYVKWGPFDNLPQQIYALAKSSPYTAAPLRYLSDLSTGLGVRYMYRFPDGKVCEFKDAGARLRQEMEELEVTEQNNTYEVSLGGKASGSKSKALRRAREAYDDWYRVWHGYSLQVAEDKEIHVPMVKDFLDNNDLDRHFSQSMQEFNMFDLFFPTVGFERGENGLLWNPKIVSLGFLSIVHGGIRYEVMNDKRHIEHIYFGEMFRAKGLLGEHSLSGADHHVMMYPVAEQYRRVKEWEYVVEKNRRKRVGARPTWSVCPIAYGTRNYYQQPDWWSIFPIKAFDFSSTILYDKAKQRENRTSWGKIIYISLDYLDLVFADEGIAGDKEKQQEFIEQLDQSVETFLQHRENNGKMMRQFMWDGPDGKPHHNVEIVDVSDVSNDEAKAGKEELELSTNPIFLAFGVDPRDVGVPMVSASNGGTALREIRLMKQQLLHIRQRMYVKLLTDIATYNGWTLSADGTRNVPGFWAVKQMTFTTLDNSKTGTVETIAGEGA